MKVTRWLVLAAWLAAAGALAFAGEVVDGSTGQKFAPGRQVANAGKTYDLSCVGTGVRKKMVIKVYALGFYVENAYRQQLAAKWKAQVPKAADLEDQAAFFQSLVKDTYCRQFEMKFVREVDAEKVRDAFTEGLENNLPQMKQKPELAAAAKKFVGWFQGTIAEGDRLVITLFPDGTIIAAHNDKPLGTMQDAALVPGVTAIWMGKECISETLRAEAVRLFY